MHRRHGRETQLPLEIDPALLDDLRVSLEDTAMLRTRSTSQALEDRLGDRRAAWRSNPEEIISNILLSDPFALLAFARREARGAYEQRIDPATTISQVIRNVGQLRIMPLFAAMPELGEIHIDSSHAVLRSLEGVVEHIGRGVTLVATRAAEGRSAHVDWIFLTTLRAAGALLSVCMDTARAESIARSVAAGETLEHAIADAFQVSHAELTMIAADQWGLATAVNSQFDGSDIECVDALVQQHVLGAIDAANVVSLFPPKSP